MPTSTLARIRRDEQPPEIAIAGGGIVGLSCARSLARHGANVTIFEKGSIGSGSTPLAAGGIRTQFGQEADVRMMSASVRAWEELAAAAGTDIQYRQAGYLLCLADSEQVESMKAALEMQQSLGHNNQLLQPDEATDYCPGLNHERYEAVTHGPQDGYLDPHSALMRFKELAEAEGVDIRTECGVHDLIQYANGRVVGVKTPEGRFSADLVINAAGAWAPELAAKAGISLPITPTARRAATVLPDPEPMDELPLVVDFGSGFYFRPLGEDLLLVGGHFDDDADDERDATVEPRPSPMASAPHDWQQELSRWAPKCASYFGPQTELVDTWEGRYAMTPDEAPIIERSCPGLYTAAGFSGHGLMMAPATGQLIAELVFDADEPLVAPATYSRHRFDNPDDVTHRGRVPQF